MPEKNILLIAPGYKNKYPPIGLMKLATYHGEHGKGDNVAFIKGEDDKTKLLGLNKAVMDIVWDRIYVTTLFSFEWKKISDSIDFALAAAGGQASKVFAGGIAVSLMQGRFQFLWSFQKMSPAIRRWDGIRSMGSWIMKSGMNLPFLS